MIGDDFAKVRQFYTSKTILVLSIYGLIILRFSALHLIFKIESVYLSPKDHSCVQLLIIGWFGYELLDY